MNPERNYWIAANFFGVMVFLFEFVLHDMAYFIA